MCVALLTFTLIKSLTDFRVFSVSLKRASYNEKYVFQNVL